MANEKWQMENGKSRLLPSAFFLLPLTLEKSRRSCAELFPEHRYEGAGAAVAGFKSCSGDLLARREELHSVKQPQLLPPLAESHLRLRNKKPLDRPLACAAVLAQPLERLLLGRFSHESVDDSHRSRVRWMRQLKRDRLRCFQLINNDLDDSLLHGDSLIQLPKGAGVKYQLSEKRRYVNYKTLSR